MKKHRRTKLKTNISLQKKRCDERLGVQIDRKAIQRRIKEQKFDKNFYLLNRQSNRVTWYRYKFQDKCYIIPYDKNSHKVITIFEDNKQDVIIEQKNQCSENNFSTWVEKLIHFVKKSLKTVNKSYYKICVLTINFIA